MREERKKGGKEGGREGRKEGRERRDGGRKRGNREEGGKKEGGRERRREAGRNLRKLNLRYTATIRPTRLSFHICTACTWKRVPCPVKIWSPVFPVRQTCTAA
jgi:hypothetical protein